MISNKQYTQLMEGLAHEQGIISLFEGRGRWGGAGGKEAAGRQQQHGRGRLMSKSKEGEGGWGGGGEGDRKGGELEGQMTEGRDSAAQEWGIDIG